MDTEIDAKTFWKAIGCRAIGVAIVTAKGADGPAGFLALSATHLSASPPMMMVSIGLITSALGAVRQSNHFAINYEYADGTRLFAQCRQQKGCANDISVHVTGGKGRDSQRDVAR